MEVKGNIEYIVFEKDNETCYASLKNIDPINEPILNFKALEGEKEFLINGNKEICNEFREKDEITSLYLTMTKIFNHPTSVEIITQKTDQFYDTPFLLDYQFALLHSFYFLIILMQILTIKFTFPKYVKLMIYLVLLYIGIGGYFIIERKVKFQFYKKSLHFEIVNSE